ncbi:MAG: Smr/MutS family protein [Bacteroidota bacterium]|nr:Smr/MutS family protein [Bacteroidota bacterium]
MNIGNKVAVLDDDIQGVVIRIQDNRVTLLTDDGFELEYTAKELIVFDSELLNTASVSRSVPKKEAESKPKYINKKQKTIEVSFDLHIEKLVKSTKGMQSFDMLELQIETAQRHIDFALEKRMPKIVLIHGVGDGRLRAEIEYMLRRYENVWFQEANYQRYGQGAIEINFKQDARRSF